MKGKDNVNYKINYKNVITLKVLTFKLFSADQLYVGPFKYTSAAAKAAIQLNILYFYIVKKQLLICTIISCDILFCEK